jgi:hypothetical protein
MPVHKEFDTGDRAITESAANFRLATSDEHGRPSVSYKGVRPGFVHRVAFLRVLVSRSHFQKHRATWQCARHQEHRQLLPPCDSNASGSSLMRSFNLLDGAPLP